MTSRLAKLSPAEAVSLAMRMVDELPDSTVALVVKAIATRVCATCGHKNPCRCESRAVSVSQGAATIDSGLKIIWQRNLVRHD